jgi:hypothetical protein
LQHDWAAAAGRLLLAAVVLIPIMWDMLSFSNRFAGPVYRMRRVLREVARGGAIQKVQLREGDFWHGLADDLNSALQRFASTAPTGEVAIHDEACEDDRVDLSDDFLVAYGRSS